MGNLKDKFEVVRVKFWLGLANVGSVELVMDLSSLFQLIMATGLLATAHTITLQLREAPKQRIHHSPQLVSSKYHLALFSPPFLCLSSLLSIVKEGPWEAKEHAKTLLMLKLLCAGLSFRTTQESLRNAFQEFGQLVEVNLVMDRIANRPRGFAFLRYATEEESKKAIEGMHGKFLDGRVIFVEVAKPRSEVQKNKQKS
ncbi:hypothetical protein Cgig2_031299 [Carnegiea gigantea]|uniref:RRM domain-containing protein n=1 Tax=Carnegiea gigantea TaxID=171969 RepID=A0A9Q1QL12_9CARY|nr:hypothetical protein Cgig2_031299 [Carnegiea gigantea]